MDTNGAKSARQRDIVVIGAPVGGAAALAEVISDLPGDLEASIFVVLHATPENPILLPDILNAPGRMRAAEAQNEEAVERRRIYIAGTGRHLMFRDGRICLSRNGVEHPYRPSIDRLFTSAAESFRERVVGVILLHAREDGARGLHAIRQAGGRTVTHRHPEALEELTSPETGQPLADEHLGLKEIARCILSAVNGLAE